MSMFYFNKTCHSVQEFCSISNLISYNQTHCYNGQNETGIVPAQKAVSLISSSEDYYRNRMLGVTGTTWEDMGGMNWELVGCLALSWVLVAICMINGIKSFGKAIYFFAIFPYVVLIIFLVRGLTLNGAYQGIQFYILQPNITKLAEIQVWNDAAAQLFYSLGIAYGALITLSSYNKLKNNCMRDAMTVTLANCSTSVFAGFVIFSVLGFMATEINVPVKDVADSGSGLAFVAYPAAIARMPYPAVWSVLFFTMLICLGIDSQFTFVEALAAGLFDSVESLRPKKPYVMVCLCFVLFLLGIPFCLRGGIYLFELINTYAAGISVLFITICEVICVIYIYGFRNFIMNIKKDMGVHVNPFFYCYWKITWLFFTPATLLIILGLGIYYFQPVGWGSYIFPPRIQMLGWFMTIGSIAPIPIFAVYAYIKSGKKGKELITPTDQFCPAYLRQKNKNLSSGEFRYVYNNEGYSADSVPVNPITTDIFASTEYMNNGIGILAMNTKNTAENKIHVNESSSELRNRDISHLLDYADGNTDIIQMHDSHSLDNSVQEKQEIEIGNFSGNSKINVDNYQENSNSDINFSPENSNNNDGNSQEQNTHESKGGNSDTDREDNNYENDVSGNHDNFIQEHNNYDIDEFQQCEGHGANICLAKNNPVSSLEDNNIDSDASQKLRSNGIDVFIENSCGNDASQAYSSHNIDASLKQSIDTDNISEGRSSHNNEGSPEQGIHDSDAFIEYKNQSIVSSIERNTHDNDATQGYKRCSIEGFSVENKHRSNESQEYNSHNKHDSQENSYVIDASRQLNNHFDASLELNNHESDASQEHKSHNINASPKQNYGSEAVQDFSSNKIDASLDSNNPSSGIAEKHISHSIDASSSSEQSDHDYDATQDIKRVSIDLSSEKNNQELGSHITEASLEQKNYGSDASLENKSHSLDVFPEQDGNDDDASRPYRSNGIVSSPEKDNHSNDASQERKSYGIDASPALKTYVINEFQDSDVSQDEGSHDINASERYENHDIDTTSVKNNHVSDALDEYSSHDSDPLPKQNIQSNEDSQECKILSNVASSELKNNDRDESQHKNNGIDSSPGHSD